MAKIHKFSDFTGPVITELHVKNNTHSHFALRCRHHLFEIDESSRRIWCKECGEEIDPFTVVLEYANNQRDFIWKVKRHRVAIEEFEKIQQEWSLTIREKRRITKAMQNASIPKLENGEII